MLRGFLIALVLLLMVGVPLFALKWHVTYSEAETRSFAAQDFGRSLAQRLTQEGRRDAELADIKALLADERFARLRDRAFVPSFTTNTLITLRINDYYEFPIATDGTVSWRKRK